MGPLSASDLKRFWAKVDKRSDNECWPWLVSSKNWGYGSFWLHGSNTLAHRVSFFLTTGEVPEQVNHHCDNPGCVNPTHLFAGSQLANMRDRNGKNRANFCIGSRCPWARITEQDVLAIRTRKANGELSSDLAKEYHLSGRHIRGILIGMTWKHVGGIIERQPPSVSSEQVQHIRRLFKDGMQQREIARLIGTTHTVVWNVVHNKTHRNE